MDHVRPDMDRVRPDMDRVRPDMDRVRPDMDHVRPDMLCLNVFMDVLVQGPHRQGKLGRNLNKIPGPIKSRNLKKVGNFQRQIREFEKS